MNRPYKAQLNISHAFSGWEGSLPPSQFAFLRAVIMKKLPKLLRELSPAISILQTGIGGIVLAEAYLFPGVFPEWVGEAWIAVSIVIGGVLIVAHSKA